MVFGGVQVFDNIGKPLDKAADEGGLDAIEAVCAIARMPLALLLTEEDAHRILWAMRAMFERGIAEERRRVARIFDGQSVQPDLDDVAKVSTAIRRCID